MLLIISGILNDVRKKFPHSLNHDVLLANCCWEHLMQWNKNKDSVNHLELALSSLNFVGSAVIKNGNVYISWQFVLKIKIFAKFCMPIINYMILITEWSNSNQFFICDYNIFFSFILLCIKSNKKDDFQNFCNSWLVNIKW